MGMKDVVDALAKSPGWALGLVGGVAGVYVATTRPDWLLGVFSVVLIIATVYILRLEGLLRDETDGELP